MDASGALYVTDNGNCRIQQIDADEVITTIAGTGEPGFTGDGGPATEAQFNGVHGLAVDSAGNLYVSDAFNHRFRMIDSAGIITTIAGTGEQGFSGDGGRATEAQFFVPTRLARDGPGNLDLSDSSDGGSESSGRQAGEIQSLRSFRNSPMVIPSSPNWCW